jgi:hypothetical protein
MLGALRMAPGVRFWLCLDRVLGCYACPLSVSLSPSSRRWVVYCFRIALLLARPFVDEPCNWHVTAVSRFLAGTPLEAR